MRYSMRRRLSERYSQDYINELYYSAGNCYELEGNVPEALRMYELCHNEAGISRILIENMRKNPAAGDYFELKQYYLSLSEEEIKKSVELMAGMSMLQSILLNEEDGTAGFLFKHASDYTVIISEYPMDGTDEPKKPSEPQDETKPDQPQEPEAAPHVQVKSVKLSKKVFTYSGKAKKPSVAAVDTNGKRISGKYYSVTYKDNKKVGKASAIVTFKNGYSGTIKKVFTIRPAGTSIKKTTAVTGGFTIQWEKKTAQTSGYQVQYSKNAGFKGNSTHSVFVKKASLTKRIVRKQKAGKACYVRIRTYKTVKTAGKSMRIYSAWSGCNSISFVTFHGVRK